LAGNSFYPTPEVERGAPLGNPNLKLVVLNELRTSGLIDLGSEEELATFVLGREADLETEGSDFSPEIYEYLVRYPLTQAQLSSITELNFDGGNEIYFYVWYHWDGESDEFTVTSLAGIEKCENLRAYNEATMVEDCDLNDLLPLRNLESVQFGDGSLHRGGRALLELPALRSVTCFESSLLDSGVLAELSAKGVTVKIYS
jgi:hypothetical protein